MKMSDINFHYQQYISCFRIKVHKTIVHIVKVQIIKSTRRKSTNNEMQHCSFVILVVMNRGVREAIGAASWQIVGES